MVFYSLFVEDLNFRNCIPIGMLRSVEKKRYIPTECHIKGGMSVGSTKVFTVAPKWITRNPMIISIVFSRVPASSAG